VPFGIRFGAEETFVDWCRAGDERFRDPFFDQTIDRLRRADGERIRTTSVEDLLNVPRVSPAAFVFHMSRCGSTLVTQALCAVPQFLSISEPAIVETVLRGRPDTDATAPILQCVISALSHPRAVGQSAVFIKLTSRSAAHLPLFRHAFPDVPRIVLYRDPLEVVSALMRGTRGTIPPGLPQALLDSGDSEIRPAEFWARVLARFCLFVAQDYDPRTTLLVHYAELPAAVWERIVPFAGQTCSDADIERMLRASRFDSKKPLRLFAPDRERRDRVVTEEMVAAVEQFARGPYQSLEALRLARASR